MMLGPSKSRESNEVSRVERDADLSRGIEQTLRDGEQRATYLCLVRQDKVGGHPAQPMKGSVL